MKAKVNLKIAKVELVVFVVKGKGCVVKTSDRYKGVSGLFVHLISVNDYLQSLSTPIVTYKSAVGSLPKKANGGLWLAAQSPNFATMKSTSFPSFLSDEALRY
jgi:hypothetical protein